MKTLYKIASLLTILALSACTQDIDLLQTDAEQNRSSNFKLKLDLTRTEFDNSDTRGVSFGWKEQDTIYLRFHTNSGIVTGHGIYTGSRDDWSVSINDANKLNRETESTVEVTYFDGANEPQNDIVKISYKTGVYQDLAATYTLSAQNVLSISAHIRPITGRIRFKGATYSIINGLKYNTQYNLATGQFTSSNDNIFLFVSKYDADSFSDYIYASFDNADTRTITLRENGGGFHFNRSCDSRILAVGKSGWMNSPTSTDHNGWTMTQVSGVINGVSWVDLGLPSGNKWSFVYNIGTDLDAYYDKAYLKDIYGQYFRWGATNETGSYYTGNTNIAQTAYDIATHTLGGGWQLPTKEDFQELIDCCTWKWRIGWFWDAWERGDVDHCYEITGPNGECIILTAAGWNSYGYSSTPVGRYWTSSPVPGTSNAYYCSFDDNASSITLTVGAKNTKLSIRPIIKGPNASTPPDDDQNIIAGHQAVDLGLSVNWATCNVGANSEEEEGYNFAWGETVPKSSYTTSNSETYNKTQSFLTASGVINSQGNLTTPYDAASANWGDSWRMPTDDEVRELIRNCTATSTKQNGVSGIRMTASNGNSIFLPNNDFWASTIVQYLTNFAYCLCVSANDLASCYYKQLYIGRPVRAVTQK